MKRRLAKRLRVWGWTLLFWAERVDDDPERRMMDVIARAETRNYGGSD